MQSNGRKRIGTGHDVPPVDQVVKVWGADWTKQQIKNARLYREKRRGDRDQHKTPFIVAFQAGLSYARPVIMIGLLLAGVLYLGKLGRDQGGTFSNFGVNNNQAAVTATPLAYCEDIEHPPGSRCWYQVRGMPTPDDSYYNEQETPYIDLTPMEWQIEQLSSTPTLPSPIIVGCTPGPFGPCP